MWAMQLPPRCWLKVRFWQSVGILLLPVTLATLDRYHKVESLVGADFFESWKFYNGPDPTHGTVRALKISSSMSY